MAEKKTIYYARTYRRISTSKTKCLLYMCILILPMLLVLRLHLDDLTRWICEAAQYVFREFCPDIAASICSKEYSLLGTVNFLNIGTVYPDFQMCLINAAVSLAVIIFIGSIPWRGRPLAIYLLLNFGIHLISSLWFLFARDYFPFTLARYSELYMVQEVGLWLVFLLMTGAVTGIIGHRGFLEKFLTVLCVLVYSIVFGAVRYIVFLYLLYRYSVLYMALLYFTLGCMFDFVYLVMIYAFFINRMIRLYDSQAGKGVWKWS